MPIYSYRCDKCGETKEVLQRMSDHAPKHCESEMIKYFSPDNNSSFRLKGNGYYATDFKNKR